MKYHLSFALTLIFAAELQDRHIPALSCRLRLAQLFHRQREVDDRDQNTATVEGAVATGTREMIVVLRNSQTLHYGSMYSNSVTTGNWKGSSPTIWSPVSTPTAASFLNG